MKAAPDCVLDMAVLGALTGYRPIGGDWRADLTMAVLGCLWILFPQDSRDRRALWRDAGLGRKRGAFPRARRPQRDRTRRARTRHDGSRRARTQRDRTRRDRPQHDRTPPGPRGAPDQPPPSPGPQASVALPEASPAPPPSLSVANPKPAPKT